MTSEEAQRIAHAYAARSLEVYLCENRGLYGFDPASDYLFAVSYSFQTPGVGGGRYIAVSKKDGVVRDLHSTDE